MASIGSRGAGTVRLIALLAVIASPAAAAFKPGLGLFCEGNGPLDKEIANAAADSYSGRDVFVVRFDDEGDPLPQEPPEPADKAPEFARVHGSAAIPAYESILARCPESGLARFAVRALGFTQTETSRQVLDRQLRAQLTAHSKSAWITLRGAWSDPWFRSPENLDALRQAAADNDAQAELERLTAELNDPAQIPRLESWAADDEARGELKRAARLRDAVFLIAHPDNCLSRRPADPIQGESRWSCVWTCTLDGLWSVEPPRIAPEWMSFGLLPCSRTHARAGLLKSESKAWLERAGIIYQLSSWTPRLLAAGALVAMAFVLMRWRRRRARAG